MDLFTLALIKNKQGGIGGGIDTSDANVIPSKMAMGYSGYVNGQKIEGEAFDVGTGSMDYSVYDISLDEEEQRVRITLKMAMDYLINMGGELVAIPKYSHLATGINLTADKIVKGETILGVEGTATTGKEVDYSLLSGNNYTIKFAENPIEFLTASHNLTNLTEGEIISITGHYKSAGSPDAAMGNYFRKNTNEVVRHKDTNNIMTYYAYFSDETLPFATDLVDTSAYTTAGYYTIDYSTMSIKERVGSTLTLNFTYNMNSIRAMYQIVDGVRKWIDITTDNEQQWQTNFKDLIETIYPYEETIEVKELKAKIAELETEMTEANAIIDQLNGEEV